MTQQVIDQTSREAPAESDLTAAVQRVLAESAEPLTLSKIRAALPSAFRRMPLEELAEALQRQVAATVLRQYPKYRSAQDRFWDRPMPVHVAQLIRITLEERPLAWSQLRRKLPSYAVAHAEAVLQELVAQGQVHCHPPAGSRGRERFGMRQPDPKDYLRMELPGLFRRLQQLGFTDSQLREAAMELLQEAEWSQVEQAPSQPETRAEGDSGPSVVPTSAEAGRERPAQPAPVGSAPPRAEPRPASQHEP